MSAATSFYTTFQQLALSLGIATAASCLAGSMAVRGHAQPQLADFSTAFVIVALISLLAPLVNLGMDPNAGAELSGQTVPAKGGAKAAAP
jgi:hypothetical protein